MNLSHTVKAFHELSVTELYDLLRLRSEVFVVEQNCVFLDLDNKDQKCYHLLLYQENEMVAYCYQLFGPCNIRLGAQTYALGFYESLGFRAEGDTYDEDGIEHIEMVRKAKV